MYCKKEMDLVIRLKYRDEKALHHLIETYEGYVGSIIQSVSRNTLSIEDKEEVLSDVFIAIWYKAHTIDSNRLTCLKSYIGAIARNKSKNKLRELSGRSLVSVYRLQAVSYDDTFNGVIKHETSRKLVNALYKLEKTERLCFVKYYYQQKSVREIATETGANLSTVKSKLARGRKKLKIILDENQTLSKEYLQ